MENITLGNIQNLMVFVASMLTSGGVICGFIYRLINKKQKEQQKLLKLEIQKLLEPFNKRIDETIENNNKRFDALDKKVDNNDIYVVRRSISAFDNLCRLDINNNAIQKHQYNTAYLDIDKWAYYHKLYPELNGEINDAIENIKEHYKNAKF